MLAPAKTLARVSATRRRGRGCPRPIAGLYELQQSISHIRAFECRGASIPRRHERRALASVAQGRRACSAQRKPARRQALSAFRRQINTDGWASDLPAVSVGSVLRSARVCAVSQSRRDRYILVIFVLGLPPLGFRSQREWTRSPRPRCSALV